MIARNAFLFALLALFGLSGFAGLIYESIWSHYLKLFLGHAAYAQTLVLSIFMGGMAVGAWIAGRRSESWTNLLLGYALVEGVIGVLGVVFHGVFVRSTEFAHLAVLPSIESAPIANTFKWTLGILLILPQSILLGMTFPLMSGGLIRRFPSSPGGMLAILYFTNSVGAAVGVLVSGFVLINVVGLPGTVLTAGLINVALAIAVWALINREPPEVSIPSKPETVNPTELGWFRLMLTVALLTGLSSFMYEIGWIRMLSLVLGSSTHSFELMLSAFILGLALGSLWIRKRIDRYRSPIQTLAIVQMLMGGCALLSLPLYGSTSDVMHWLLQSVNRSDGGYLIFNMTSHVLAMMVMLPATFFAGMTLPLVTFSLLRHGHGEKSIGAVYAANTAGAIAGIFIAVHLALPLTGLKGTITAGAAIDIALGLVLLWMFPRPVTPASRSTAVTYTVGGLAALSLVVLFVGLDPIRMASGVYRHGLLLDAANADILRHKDGKTSSIDLMLLGSQISIHTNGKPDASIELDAGKGHSLDEPTMILAAAVPMAYFPTARTVAIIGMGSGLTSNTFLENPEINRVDTIEIESAMVELAKGFRPRTEKVYTDPRSYIHIEDAKTFFSTQNRRYDIIASEPSNPWVSGTSSLFTDEFYRHVRRHLADDGLLVQWVQIYEIDVPLVMTVLKAVSKNFSDYVIYASNDVDLLIIAKKKGALGKPSLDRIFSSPVGETLSRVAIRSKQDFWLHRIGSRATLDPLVKAWKIPLNSDYFPILDQNAARTRFLDRNAFELTNLANASIPLLEMLGEPAFQRDQTGVVSTPTFSRSRIVNAAAGLRDFFVSPTAINVRHNVGTEAIRDAEILQLLARDCSRLSQSTIWSEIAFEIAQVVNTHLTASELKRVWANLGLDRCTKQLTSDQKTWLSLFKAVGERDAKSMAQHAETLLAGGRQYNLTQLRYLLSAGMLGHIASGRPAKAQILLDQHVQRIPGGEQADLAIRLLALHSRKSQSDAGTAVVGRTK